MCTLKEDSRLRKPKTDTFIAYKVFEVGPLFQPRNYTASASFKFGTNEWDAERADRDNFGDQKGFQMFAYKKDALRYATGFDEVCGVEVETKDIAKIGRVTVSHIFGLDELPKAYEVVKFELLKKDWDKKVQQQF